MDDKIQKEEISKMEEFWKNKIFETLASTRELSTGTLREIRDKVQKLGLSNEQIPDPIILLNNKLVELIHIFSQSGLSLFVSWNDQYSIPLNSFVGSSIIYNLLDMASEAIKLQSECCNVLVDMINKRTQRFIAYENSGRLKKLYLKSKAEFDAFTKSISVNEALGFGFTEQELTIFNETLKKYIDYSHQIYNYNLEDNLIPALIKEIVGSDEIGSKKYDYYVVAGLVEELVIPVLIKLGYEHLIPKLKAELNKEYEIDRFTGRTFKIFDDVSLSDEGVKR